MKGKIKRWLANSLRSLGLWKTLSLPKEALTTEEYFKQYYSTYSPEKTTIFGPSFREETLPGTLSQSVGWKFTCLQKRVIPEAFVLRLENGRVWGVNGAVITREGVLLSDVSREFGNRNRHTHSSLQQLRINKPGIRKANIAVLATEGGNTYYHWMFDVLPRLYLLEQAGVLDAIDLFVVPPVRSRFQQESLQILGISDSRLLVSDSPDFHVQATNLFVPSLPSLLGSVNYWASGFIRDRVLGKGLPVVPAAKRIYISRKKAGNRKLSNEDALDGWLDRNGFTTIIAESYSLLEQAAIFNTAEVVMALHGSGLSNIAFCKPGAVIIELFSSSFIVPCFWIVANNHSLKYYYLQDEHKEERPFAPYWEGVATDFALSETMLDKILQASTIP